MIISIFAFIIFVYVNLVIIWTKTFYQDTSINIVEDYKQNDNQSIIIIDNPLFMIITLKMMIF
jgi:hypothetical protein